MKWKIIFTTLLAASITGIILLNNNLDWSWLKKPKNNTKIFQNKTNNKTSETQTLKFPPFIPPKNIQGQPIGNSLKDSKKDKSVSDEVFYICVLSKKCEYKNFQAELKKDLKKNYDLDSQFYQSLFKSYK